MLTERLHSFLLGATTLGFAALAVFFLRFWVRSRDRLFLGFALAFAIFALSRLAMLAFDAESEGELLVYGARALSYSLIVLAIVGKNRAAGGGPGDAG